MDANRGNCLQHPLLYALNDTQPMISVQFLLRYPLLHIGNVTLDNALIFGGVRLDATREDRHGNRAIISARALRLPYVLQPTTTADSRYMRSIVEQWLDQFIQLMLRIQRRYHQTSTTTVSIYFTSSISLPAEMERNGQLIIPYMPLLFFSLLAFCMLCSCDGRLDWVRSKPGLAFCGILNAIFAVVSAVGTLIYVGYPFLHMVCIMPFLIICK
jgi:hypothetical protein